ncbi:MAG: hypothetical protein AAF589_06520, partial [Planctomycetota bacterium]
PMSENPFASPQTAAGEELSAVGVLSGSREDLRKVAVYQKGIVSCIGLYLLTVFAQFAVPPTLAMVLAIFALIVVITGAVFTVLLALKVYGVGLGILMGILTFIPLIGLFVLLITNQKATSVLKQNGVKVGLLGADLSKL